MNIIVFGPTGGTGRLLLEKARLSGHSVTAFARAGSAIAQSSGPRVVAGSVLDAEAVAAAMAGHDAVLSALGGRPWRSTSICAPAIRTHGPS
jgi:putative NADH-flavin reductase